MSSGRVWRITIFMAMERYGENEVTPLQVCHTMIHLFPKLYNSSIPLYAEYELNQTRKMLTFIRDPCVKNPPFVKDLLRPLLLGNNWGEGARRLDMREIRQNFRVWNQQVLNERLLSSAKSAGRHADDHHSYRSA